jgi:hypothetical protein
MFYAILAGGLLAAVVAVHTHGADRGTTTGRLYDLSELCALVACLYALIYPERW